MGEIFLSIILGTILPILLVCIVIACYVTICCLLYKKCRKPRRPSVTTVVYTTPQQPLPVPAHQPSNPGYQPVPLQPGYEAPPIPAGPPPSYLEATAFPPVQPMYPFSSPPHAPPPHLQEHIQPPYNPSYGLNP